MDTETTTPPREPEPVSASRRPFGRSFQRRFLHSFGRSSLRSSLGLAVDVMIALLVSLFIIVFLYQPVRVEGTSMVPMLQDQDRLFINKVVYRVGEIQRGDVIVFHYPRDPEKSYIKRVVGLPGDQIRIERGCVFLNGHVLKEGYVPSRYADERSEPELAIPANAYYVMGDHRSISSDSRDFGTVDRRFIYGRAAFVYWPMSEAGVVR